MLCTFRERKKPTEQARYDSGHEKSAVGRNLDQIQRPSSACDLLLGWLGRTRKRVKEREKQMKEARVGGGKECGAQLTAKCSKHRCRHRNELKAVIH